MKTAPGDAPIFQHCLFIYAVLQIQQVSNHGRSVRADEPSWQRRIQRGICCVICVCICLIFDQVYKAYDLVELRTVALKIHELNAQWSEEKKVPCNILQMNAFVDDSTRQITCAMQRVKAPFKKHLTTVASFDCRATSPCFCMAFEVTHPTDTMFLNSVPIAFAPSWNFAKALI
jgi:hypothetical protein